MVANPPEISPSASIEVADFVIGEGSSIGANVRIQGRSVHLGRHVRLSDGVSITGFKKPGCEEVRIGDDVFLGQNVHLALPHAVLGDYVKVHRNCSLFGERKLVLGHDAWCGEAGTLNSSGGLYVGNNVGVATRDGVWTHVGHGELLEGCILRSFTPTVLWHNSWLLPDVSVSSGVEVAEFSVVLANSVVTKSTQPNRIYAGAPARELAGAKPPFAPVTPEGRVNLIGKFIDEFVAEGTPPTRREETGEHQVWHRAGDAPIAVLRDTRADPRALSEQAAEFGPDALVFGYGLREAGPEVTCFDLKGKTYTKRHTPAERALVAYLAAGLAKFAPLDCPVLEAKFLEECVTAIRAQERGDVRERG